MVAAQGFAASRAQGQKTGVPPGGAESHGLEDCGAVAPRHVDALALHPKTASLPVNVLPAQTAELSSPAAGERGERHGGSQIYVVPRSVDQEADLLDAGNVSKLLGGPGWRDQFR